MGGAQKRYIDIAKGLGWDGAIPEEDDDVDLERLDEDDEAKHQGTGNPKGQGMGTNVSVMAQGAPDDGADEWVHLDCRTIFCC